MGEWMKMKLKDLISIKGGYSYKGKFIGEGSSFLLGMGCVSFSEKFLKAGARLYSGECPDTHLAEPGDIVLATRQQSDNMPILGLPAIIPNDYIGEKVIVGTNLYKVINNSDVDNDFLFWLFKSPNYRNHILTCSKGTTVRMITKDAVESFEFYCPSEQDRKNICDTLWSIEKKIDLLHRQNKTLEGMAEALFRQWFIEEAGDDWEDGCLGDVAVNITNSVKPNEIKPDEIYIGLEHIEKHTISMSNKGRGEEVASNKYSFQKGDILFGKLRPYFHKVCFAPFAGICSTDILVIRPKEKHLFGYCLFAFFQNDVVEYANLGSGGTRMPRTNWKVLSQYPMAMPTDNRLKEFNELITPSIEKIEQNQKQIRTLEKLRDTLLPKLMTGEVKVQHV